MVAAMIRCLRTRERRVIVTLAFLAFASAGFAEDPKIDPEKLAVQHIDLIHFSHTDIGFTDHPIVCRELQKRYLDIAIDAALATRDRSDAAKFYWTAEGTLAVDDWWQTASPKRRDDLLKAVASGQIAIAAVAMNNTPFLNRQEWHEMLHWLPDDLWKQFHPDVAIQNDVNGFPRAGALALLDRGVTRLFTGINEDSGGVPFKRPSAFWWKMPDGRRLFVYLSYSYPAGFDFFESAEWRHGPVPHAGDTRFRPPREGDFFASDEASVQKAHARLLTKLRNLEADGYRYPYLLLSTTSQWRIDNDPPFRALADFVATWNRLELKPTLRFTTASVGMKRLEAEIGSQVPEHQGEWTDWWANGTASAPREVAASRIAKRVLEAAESPLWGEMNANGRRVVTQSLRELCLFDEHTWGSSNSCGLPYSLDAQGQFNEKASLAYRPMVRAEWLLGQRVRSRLAAEPEGLYVANSSPASWSGWVRMPTTVLRDDYRSLEDAKSGDKLTMYYEKGLRPFSQPQNAGELTRENDAAVFPDNAERQVVKFWVDALPGQTIRSLRLSKQDVEAEKPAASPDVTRDERGWPTSIIWPGMTKPLFLPGTGNFISVGVKGFAPRWATMRVFGASDADREKVRSEVLEETTATATEQATFEENPHTLVFTQALNHPRLSWITRRLEVWKQEPRATLSVRINRISSDSPEAYFVDFPLPCEGTMPKTSCGGVPFVPYTDQLPGTCRDYFAIDGWVHYQAPEGHWLWVSRDAPLATFGGQHVKARLKGAPDGLHRVLAMVFDNLWYTNFVGNSHGDMEFRFDLAWRPDLPDSEVEKLAKTLAAEPQVIINPGLKEDPIFMKRLYEP